MKTTTYLIYKQQPDGTKRLEIATHAEWTAILKHNQGLPMGKRRCFILDAIEDGPNLDLMYIEVTLEEYRKWHSARVASERNRESRMGYEHISINASEKLSNTLPWDYRLDEIIHDRVLMEELRRALHTWRPWANDMLDAYLAGEQRRINAKLAKKYGVSERVIRKYKRQFEAFVASFLSP